MTQKCDRCGWKFPGFHICVDLSVPMKEEAQPRKKRPMTKSSAWAAAIEQGRNERWAKHREEMFERDADIVRKYKDGAGLKALADEFGIAYQTVRGVVARAEARGEVVLRPRGNNIRWERKRLEESASSEG